MCNVNPLMHNAHAFTAASLFQVFISFKDTTQRDMEICTRNGIVLNENKFQFF